MSKSPSRPLQAQEEYQVEGDTFQVSANRPLWRIALEKEIIILKL